jgi:hypothetical protein
MRRVQRDAAPRPAPRIAVDVAPVDDHVVWEVVGRGRLGRAELDQVVDERVLVRPDLEADQPVVVGPGAVLTAGPESRATTSFAMARARPGSTRVPGSGTAPSPPVRITIHSEPDFFG